MAEGVTGKLESDGLAAAGPLSGFVAVAVAVAVALALALAIAGLAGLAGPNRMQRQYLSAPTSLE